MTPVRLSGGLARDDEGDAAAVRRHAAAPRPVTRAPQQTKTVTFILTEECNFRCSYCYLVDKKAHRRMPFETARDVIDYLLTHRELFPEPRINWDFIGGEPLLEIDTIERIIDYAQLRAYELDHPWFGRAIYSLTTNGTLYGTPRVQRLIERYRDMLSITISIDGPEHVHDIARVDREGRGTYQQVVRNIPLWLEQWPDASTKVTIAHENLRYLSESILHLMDLGIREVNANVVFEDVWHDGDDLLLEAQLDELGREMIARGLWRNHSCSFFNRGIGRALDTCDTCNWCGTGKMLAVDVEGNFYPCNRFVPFSLVRRDPRTIGNVRDGLDLNRLRPFLALTRQAQSTRECLTCEVARGCAWCQGLNYDDADSPTIYQRATHLCLMHKARVRANERFWQMVEQARAQDAQAPASEAQP
ncbi:MAG: radical SAM peptide maturase, CXXX-repeat target family [Myxococcales bacterium]|nr:radical SAM peptide maturase, CXXX-repeat target family [Myxococcales bacterium]